MARRTLVIHDASSREGLDLTPTEAYELVRSWAAHDPTFESLELVADEEILEEIPEEFDVLVGDRTPPESSETTPGTTGTI